MVAQKARGTEYMHSPEEIAEAIALAENLVSQAETEIANGDAEVAVSLVVKALNGEGVNFEIVERASRVFMSAGRPGDAVGLLEMMASTMESALEQAPNDPDLLAQIGKARFTLGHMEVAEGFLVRAAEQSGYSQELTMLICNCLLYTSPSPRDS